RPQRRAAAGGRHQAHPPQRVGEQAVRVRETADDAFVVGVAAAGLLLPWVSSATGGGRGGGLLHHPRTCSPRHPGAGGACSLKSSAWMNAAPACGVTPRPLDPPSEPQVVTYMAGSASDGCQPSGAAGANFPKRSRESSPPRRATAGGAAGAAPGAFAG